MKKLFLILAFFVPVLVFGQGIRWEQIKPISAQVEKLVPVGDDLLLIEDNAGNRQYVRIDSLGSAIGGSGGAVCSVFGRTGAVVAVSGDYNSDEITEGSTNLFSLFTDEGTVIYPTNDEDIRLGNGSEVDRFLEFRDGTSSDVNKDFRFFLDESAHTFTLEGKTTGIWSTIWQANFANDGKFSLRTGVRVDEISTDGTLAGNADDVLVTEKAIKTAIDAIPAGGNVSNTGTPVNNQVAVWTDATTIEGDPDFTFNGSSATISGGLSTAVLGAADGSLKITMNSGASGTIDFEDPFVNKLLTSAPSAPVNGTRYLNTTDNKTYERINGVWVSLGSQWIDDTNGITYQAGNVGIGQASNASFGLTVNGIAEMDNLSSSGSATIGSYISLGENTSPGGISSRGLFWINSVDNKPYYNDEGATVHKLINYKTRQSLTSGTTMSMDFNEGSKASFTIGHNATLTINNVIDGEDGIITVTQGAGTAYTLSIQGGTGYITEVIFGSNAVIDPTLSNQTKIVYERVNTELHISFIYEN
jgi:hypothetical protein